MARLLARSATALSSLLAASAASAHPSAFVADAATAGGRMRAFAAPGDLGLTNHAVTAVIRKSDGWLVDFWPNVPALPSVPALGMHTDVDGLWMVWPRLDDGAEAHDLIAGRVELGPEHVTTTTDLVARHAELRVVTTYRLDGDRPFLVVESRIEHRGGARSRVHLQDRLYLGNVDPIVDGKVVPFRFHGKASRVGRRGASGDLVYTPLQPKTMRVSYGSALPGLTAAILASYEAADLRPGAAHTVVRRFGYEPIPVEPAPAAPGGALVLRAVDELGRALPCKLALRGERGTPDPDFGNDGGLAGAGRFVWSGTGLFEVELPPGRYRALVTSGFERDAAALRVEIQPGRRLERDVVLPRVIFTPGWITGDLHLHEVSSVDAGIGRAERVVSIAAEGVEFAVATDHYVVTDYRPMVAELVARGELARPLHTVLGSEVSTVGHRFGHFNLFPMLPDTNVRFMDTTPRQLFADMRAVAPGALIQVNHPRWPSNIGYFNYFRLDPDTGTIPQSLREEYDPSFDALEVFNGLDAWSPRRVHDVLEDWMHLLGHGHRYTATGNSDSHKLFFTDPGVPRTVIHHGAAAHDGQDVFVSTERVTRALKRGRAFVTSGPYLEVDVQGAEPGDVVRVDGGKLPLRVRVRAAPWIDVSQLDVLMGPKAERIRSLPIPRSSAVVRFEQTLEIPVAHASFLVVLVKGRDPLPNVYTPGVLPMAFTNPIWIEPVPAASGAGAPGRPIAPAPARR